MKFEKGKLFDDAGLSEKDSVVHGHELLIELICYLKAQKTHLEELLIFVLFQGLPSFSEHSLFGLNNCTLIIQTFETVGAKLTRGMTFFDHAVMDAHHVDRGLVEALLQLRCSTLLFDGNLDWFILAVAKIDGRRSRRIGCQTNKGLCLKLILPHGFSCVAHTLF